MRTSFFVVQCPRRGIVWKTCKRKPLLQPTITRSALVALVSVTPTWPVKHLQLQQPTSSPPLNLVIDVWSLLKFDCITPISSEMSLPICAHVWCPSSKVSKCRKHPLQSEREKLNCFLFATGLTKMSVTRRLMDNDQKKEAFKLAELMSTVIKENITFERICKFLQTLGHYTLHTTLILESTDKASESCRYSYIASMTTMTSLLLMDGKHFPSLFSYPRLFLNSSSSCRSLPACFTNCFGSDIRSTKRTKVLFRYTWSAVEGSN